MFDGSAEKDDVAAAESLADFGDILIYNAVVYGLLYGFGMGRICRDPCSGYVFPDGPCDGTPDQAKANKAECISVLPMLLFLS